MKVVVWNHIQYLCRSMPYKQIAKEIHISQIYISSILPQTFNFTTTWRVNTLGYYCSRSVHLNIYTAVLQVLVEFHITLEIPTKLALKTKVEFVFWLVILSLRHLIKLILQEFKDISTNLEV